MGGFSMRGGILAFLVVLAGGINVSVAVAEEAPRETPRIEGRIVGENYEPVAGADIYWCPTEIDRGSFEGTVHGTTDDQGQFQLEAPAEFRIPEDWERIGRLWVIAKGYGLEGLAADRFRVRAGGGARAGLQLSPAAAFVLRVVDPEKRVREGDLVEPIHFTIEDKRPQSVMRLRVEIPRRIRERLSGVTDGTGEYAVNYVKRGSSIGFRVVSEKYGIQEEGGSEERGTVPVVTFPLQPTARIEGSTIGENKRAFAGMRLSVFSYGQDVPNDKPAEVTRLVFRATAVVDDDGRFEIPAIGPGILRVAAERSKATSAGLDPLKAPVVTAPPTVAAGATAHVTLATEAATVFRGVVVTEGTNEPVANVRVSLRARKAQLSESALTDAQGRFSITSIAADSVLTASAGVVESRDIVEVYSSPGLKEVTCPPIKLPPMRKISGRLVDSTGKPVVDADVSGLESGLYHGNAKTSKDGTFELITAAERIITDYRVEQGGKSLTVTIRNREPLELVLNEASKQ